MEIRPILSAMWRNRTGSVLVALQIALTLAIVVNSMFLAQGRIEFVGRPTGIDIENILAADSLGFGAQYQHDATIEEDLRTLRALPGVIGVTSATHVPLSGSGNGSRFRADSAEDAPTAGANVFRFDEQAAQALGVKIVEGRGFLETEILRSDDSALDRMPPTVVITKALAEKLYPDETALGKRIYNNLGESSEIVGLVELMFGSWVSWNNVPQVMWVPGRPSGPSTQYIIRTEPGLAAGMVPIVEETLSDLNRNRLVRRVRTMTEIVDGSYQGDKAMATVLMVAIGLLLAITGLGIVGLASFSVRQRTKQIGTRRAIGARKRDIIRYFLTENWLMTTIGIVIGTALTIGINYQLSRQFDLERLDYVYLPIGMGLLWLLGFLAVAEPSRRASKVSPAIATRSV